MYEKLFIQAFKVHIFCIYQNILYSIYSKRSMNYLSMFCNIINYLSFQVPERSLLLHRPQSLQPMSAKAQLREAVGLHLRGGPAHRLLQDASCLLLPHSGNYGTMYFNIVALSDIFNI